LGGEMQADDAGADARDDEQPDSGTPMIVEGSCPAGANCRSIGILGGAVYEVGAASAEAGTRSVVLSEGASLPDPAAIGAVGPGDRLILDPGGSEEVAYISARLSATELILQQPVESSHVGLSYRIERAYSALQNWADPCAATPCRSSSSGGRGGDLVADERMEVGVVYKDGPLVQRIEIVSNTTDAEHHMILTVAEGQRHDGRAGTGATIDGAATMGSMIVVGSDHTRVQWLEVRGARGGGRGGVRVSASTGVVLEFLISHDNESGIRLSDGPGSDAVVRNSIVFANISDGVEGDEPGDSLTIENCTIYGNGGDGVDPQASSVTVRNTISMGNAASDFLGDLEQSHNISSDLTAAGPASWAGLNIDGMFLSTTSGDEDFHMQEAAAGVGAGLDRSTSFDLDIDGEKRPIGNWDVGADER